MFLIIVGLTGSVLAFYRELDRWLNPELLTVPVRDAPTDPATGKDYDLPPGEAYSVWVQPTRNSFSILTAPGSDVFLVFNQGADTSQGCRLLQSDLSAKMAWTFRF